MSEFDWAEPEEVAKRVASYRRQLLIGGMPESMTRVLVVRFQDVLLWASAGEGPEPGEEWKEGMTSASREDLALRESAAVMINLWDLALSADGDEKVQADLASAVEALRERLAQAEGA